MKSFRMIPLCAYTLLVGATNAGHKVELVPPPKNVFKNSSAVSSAVLNTPTENNITHEANRSASTAVAQKPKTGNISISAQAINSSSSPATQRRLQLEKLEKALRIADQEVKAKLKELKVQSALVKEKKDAVTQEQKQVDEMRMQSEKLQKEAEVAADIAKEKAEAAAKLWKKERSAASQAEDLQAEENETSKFLEQTQKEEASLERSLAGLHEQLSRVQASPLSVKRALIPEAPRRQQLVSRGIQSYAPTRNMTGDGVEATPRLRGARTGAKAASAISAGNSTAFAPEGKKETMSKAMKLVQDENERLKHEKAELAKKLQLLQENDELRLGLKQGLLNKEQRSLAVKRLVRKH